MKAKKGVLACGLVAGLAALSSIALGDQTAVDAKTQVGYYIGKKATENSDLDEDQKETVQHVTTAAGAIVGIKTGAAIGAKVGALAGPVGVAIGAGLGAL